MGKGYSSGSAAPVSILTLPARASVASDAELVNAKHFILSFGRTPSLSVTTLESTLEVAAVESKWSEGKLI